MDGEQRKTILELIEILTDRRLTEIEVEHHDVRIRVRRDAPVESRAARHPASPAAPPPAPASGAVADSAAPPEEDATGWLTVTSPMVGTFYRSPSPDADAYVEEGDVVRKGQTLCVIEAMKLMNEIEAETDGRVVKALVENGTGVEYGQRLFVLEPLPAA